MQETRSAKLVAVVSYITIIGWIIAVILNSNERSELGSFHIRQALGIYLLSTLMIIPILNALIGLGVLVFLILGIVTAANGEQRPIPLFGELFQNWFRSI